MTLWDSHSPSTPGPKFWYNSSTNTLNLPDSDFSQASTVVKSDQKTVSDSMTVFAWLKSKSWRFKVFIGSRVTEIQELTEGHTYYMDYIPTHYMDSHMTFEDLLEATCRPQHGEVGQSMGPGCIRLPENWNHFNTTSSVGELPSGVSSSKISNPSI